MRRTLRNESSLVKTKLLLDFLKNMPKKLKSLSLILIVLGVLSPGLVSAFVLGETTTLFDLILQGISEKVMWMTLLLIGTAFAYIVGTLLLFISVSILPHFIVKQSLWMEALEPMTTAGWNFTVGLSNMLLIIIFVVIAFAFIFKIENLQAKKSLARLLIIAFLINFSLLFVNMAIDIAQIFYNTIIGAVERTSGSFLNFFALISRIIVGPLLANIYMLGIAIGALVVLFSLPYVNAIAQVVFASVFFIVFLPIIVFLNLQMAFFVPLAAMFLALSFLFAARVFILQLLAILSPLALISLILPQTKFFWSFWIKTFTEWLLLGVAFLFMLVLGLSVLQLLVPTIGGVIEADLSGWGPFGKILAPLITLLIFYFALMVYMAAILYIGKRFIPQGAQGIIGTMQGLGKTITSSVSGFATGKIKPRLPNLADRQAKQIANKRKEGYLKKQAEATRIAEGMQAGVGSNLGFKQRRATGISYRNRNQTKESMQMVAEQEGWKAKAADRQIVRAERAKIKDLSKEEAMAELYGELRKEEGKRDRQKMEALVAEHNLFSIYPSNIGNIKEAMNPETMDKYLAQHIDQENYNKYIKEEKSKEPDLSDAAAELKAAARVLEETKTKEGGQEIMENARLAVHARMIAEEMAKIKPRVLADNIDRRSIDENVFHSMTAQQAKEIQQRSDESVKQALKDFVRDNLVQIRNEVKELRHNNQRDELKQLVKKISYIKRG